ncbi:MAG: hypothetical protein H6721_15365 [Sandaracinus sp.]|nr:hypothetical protein [Sandaracinus sp.]MCB9624226.1 hypothetical protein [Sandaracinus sp.]MCB9633494.1 hypothetical protein [Sandaracinus sp.]
MTARDSARAALLLLVLVVNALEGCPVPRVSEARLTSPIGRRDLARWSRMLGVPEDTLKREVLEGSAWAADLQDTLRAPAAPLFAHGHLLQRWSLFSVADPDPWWMHVEGHIDGEWVLLYRPNDPEHAYLEDLFEYRRVRAVWNPGTDGARADYPRFVDWIAREIRARRPDVDAVRVRQLRYHVHLPGEPPNPETSWHFEEVRP